MNEDDEITEIRKAFHWSLANEGPSNPRNKYFFEADAGKIAKVLKQLTEELKREYLKLTPQQRTFCGKDMKYWFELEAEAGRLKQGICEHVAKNEIGSDCKLCELAIAEKGYLKWVEKARYLQSLTDDMGVVLKSFKMRESSLSFDKNNKNYGKHIGWGEIDLDIRKEALDKWEVFKGKITDQKQLDRVKELEGMLVELKHQSHHTIKKRCCKRKDRDADR